MSEKIYWIPSFRELASAPATPATSFWKLYPKSDGWYSLDSAGNETKVGAEVGTLNVVPRFGTSSLVDSSITDDGTTVSVSSDLSISANLLFDGSTSSKIAGDNASGIEYTAVNGHTFWAPVAKGIQVASSTAGVGTLLSTHIGTNGRNIRVELRDGDLGIYTTRLSSGEDSYVNVGSNYGFGVGVSTLTSRLHVKGTGDTSGSFTAKFDDVNGNPLFYVRDDGGVAIGTNSPSYLLTVSGSTNNHLAVFESSSNSGSGIIIKTTSTSGVIGAKLSFQASGYASAYGIIEYDNGLWLSNPNVGVHSAFNNSGDLVVGVSTPFVTYGARLHIKGSGSTSSSYGFRVDTATLNSVFTVRDDGRTMGGIASNTFSIGGANGFIASQTAFDLGAIDYSSNFSFRIYGASEAYFVARHSNGNEGRIGYQGSSFFYISNSVSSNIGVLSNDVLRLGINSGLSDIENSSALQINSTTQGFLPPRMTTVQKNAISSPVAGLTVYDSTLQSIAFHNGTSWTSTVSGSGTTNYIPKWNGAALTNSIMLENASTLEVTGSVQASNRFQSSASGYYFADAVYGDWVISSISDAVNHASGQMNISHGGVGPNLFTFTGAGRLGINKTIPAAQLHINSGGGAGNFALKIDDVSTGLNRFAFDNAGYLGINNANPIACLDIVGKGTTSSTTALNVVSSIGSVNLQVDDAGTVFVRTFGHVNGAGQDITIAQSGTCISFNGGGVKNGILSNMTVTPGDLDFNTGAGAGIKNAAHIKISTSGGIATDGGGISAFIHMVKATGNSNYSLYNHTAPTDGGAIFFTNYTETPNRLAVISGTGGGKYQFFSNTGWTMPTGTSSKSLGDADANTTVSGTPTQAEVQEIADRLRDTRRVIKAILEQLGNYVYSVTADNTTDKITLAGHGLSNGHRVKIISGTIPTGLTLNTYYFIVNKGTNDFQLSTGFGGSAIDFTTDGANLVLQVEFSGMNILAD